MFNSIQIQTIDFCNRSCYFCPNHQDIRKTGLLMSEKTFSQILAQLKKLDYTGVIKPYLQNEPLFDSRLFNFICQIRRTFPENVICIDTNGDLLSQEAIRSSLVNSGIDGIQINTYGDDALLAERGKLLECWAASHHQLSLHHSGSFRDLKKRNGYVNLWHAWIPQTLPHFWNRGGSLSGVRPHSECWRYQFCNYIFSNMYINHLGQAILCCGDWKYEVIPGQIDENSLGEIWQCQVYHHYREQHLAQEIDDLPLCKSCNRVRHLDYDMKSVEP